MTRSESILQQSMALKDTMIQWRKELHRHPELGLDTQWTQQFVYDRLVEMGYTPKKVGKAGYTVLAGKPGGKVFLLRADMDALPLDEASGESFSSAFPERCTPVVTTYTQPCCWPQPNSSRTTRNCWKVRSS